MSVRSDVWLTAFGRAGLDCRPPVETPGARPLPVWVSVLLMRQLSSRDVALCQAELQTGCSLLRAKPSHFDSERTTEILAVNRTNPSSAIRHSVAM